MEPRDLSHLLDFVDDEGLSEAEAARVRATVRLLVEDIRSGHQRKAGLSFIRLIEAGASPRLQDRLREAVNQAYADQRLELTSHGINRTFRFWPKQRRRRLVGHVDALITEIAAKVSPHVCLGYGGALGILRAGAFIPHDDDVDLLIGLPAAEFADFGAAIDFVEAQLADGSRRMSRVPAIPNLLKLHEGFHADLFIGIEEDGFFSCFPGPRRTIPVERVFPALRQPVEDGSLPCPRDLEYYVAQVFGEDWRIPQPNWNHDWAALTQFTDLLPAEMRPSPPPGLDLLVGLNLMRTASRLVGRFVV